MDVLGAVMLLAMVIASFIGDVLADDSNEEGR